MPDWADKQLSQQSSTELEAVAERVLDAISVEDLLRQRQAS
jgi:hypothetical protein